MKRRVKCAAARLRDLIQQRHLTSELLGKERKGAVYVPTHVQLGKKLHGQDIPTNASSSTLRTVLDQLAEKIKLHLSPFGFAALVLMKVWQ